MLTAGRWGLVAQSLSRCCSMKSMIRRFAIAFAKPASPARVSYWRILLLVGAVEAGLAEAADGERHPQAVDGRLERGRRRLLGRRSLLLHHLLLLAAAAAGAAAAKVGCLVNGGDVQDLERAGAASLGPAETPPSGTFSHSMQMAVPAVALCSMSAPRTRRPAREPASRARHGAARRSSLNRSGDPLSESGRRVEPAHALSQDSAWR